MPRKGTKYVMPDEVRAKLTPLLGTAPDHVIGRKFHLNRSTIFLERKALGIPPFSHRRKNGDASDDRGRSRT